MKTLFLTSVIILCFKVYAGPLIIIDNREELDSYLQRSGYNGVVLVAKEKNILLKKAFGVTKFENGRPLTILDKFEIGSLTKQFIAASFLRLQEEGKLSLNDEVTKYLPDLLVFKNIKIRDLLNHSAGINNYTSQEKFWTMVEYSRILSLDELMDFISAFPLDFEPRTKWNYSNSGYIVAGKILEIVGQQSWSDFIRNSFLLSLEMTDTGVATYFETVSDVVAHVLDDGKLVPFTAFNLSWAQSAGALYSTVDDLLKWSAIYTDSDLLTAASKNEMQTPFLQDYALGLVVKKYKNEKMVLHSGRTPGFVSTLTYLDASKLSIITLDNIDGEVALRDLLLSYFTEQKATVIRLDNYAMTEEQLKEFVGTYRSTGMNVKVLFQDSALYLLPDGQRAYKMRPNDVDSFDVERFAAEEFFRDNQGKVIGFTHYQNGSVTKFNKVNEKSLKHFEFKKLPNTFLDEFNFKWSYPAR